MKPATALSLALAVALVIVGYTCGSERADARLYRVERDSAKAREARALATARKVDSIYVRDTVTLTRWRERLVTLRDSLTITDTVEVIRYIAAADSTIAACTLALSTCERRVAARDSVIVALRERVRIETANRPSRLSVIGGRLLYLGAGYAIGRLTP